MRKKRLHIPKLEDKVKIYASEGICYVSSNTEIAGIQLTYEGKAHITPTLPDGWILQGNKNTIIIFCLQNMTFKNQELFHYLGNVNIKKAVVCNKQAQPLSDIIIKDKVSYEKQLYTFDGQETNWDNLKSKKQNKVVKKTKYNLPDYGLPAVEKIQKNKKIKVKKDITIEPISYNTGNNSTGGSSGGY